jgi:DNA (cytosine-5)-methyltransferase 1
MITYNCQDFSVAGKQAGSMWKCKDCGHEYNPLTVHFSQRHKCPECGSEELDKSRSSLLVEWLRVIRANKPNWGIYENVKNIVGKKFEDTFNMFLDELHEYGYNTYYQVLNAKDYGIPQNRERVYLIIIKKELDNGQFKFPEPFDNGLRLKDMLEEEVDEKYYINTEKSQALINELIESGKLEKDISNSVRVGGRGSIDRHQWDAVIQ